MSLARVHSAGLRGVQGVPVLVELDLAGGLPAFCTVGLPDHAVREARERVASAVRNSGFAWPNRRVTVNLAPARARKQGSHYDLPIAVALLSASGQIPAGDWSSRWCFLGELALDGRVRPVPGALPMAARARAEGFSAVVVAEENAEEARAAGLEAVAVADLREVAERIGGAPARERSAAGSEPAEPGVREGAGDLADIKGQALAKRAALAAAAGGHNLALVGPPGTGKSMLAARLPGLLPPMEDEEALEAAAVLSALGAVPARGLARRRPFRAPHHTSSAAALLGGGPLARPGEACLAHGGILFLDEAAEFPRPALEALRQPLEERVVRLSRARESWECPARFQLVLASNPCPCGWRGHPVRRCSCSPAAVARYLGRLSGPLLDRMDIQVELAAVAFGEWSGKTGGAADELDTARAREAVALARERQRRRWGPGPGGLNSAVASAALRAEGGLSEEGRGALGLAAGKLALSARALDRSLRVARTLADLAGSETVEREHVGEAMQMRALERLRSGAREAA